jgi:signal transduction histidine kinase
MKRYGSLRWILLAAGVVAILGLTGMNVYSLYALRDSTVESERENKKLQIAEFTDKIRYRFYKNFHGLGSLDIKRLENHFKKTGQFTEEVTKLLDKAASDSIYDGIFLIPSSSRICEGNEPIYKYDDTGRFIRTQEYPEVVCDGMGIARTQVKALIHEYQYNNKIIFDSHRSITIAMTPSSEPTIFGYLTMPFNQQYLRENYLQEKLVEKFGNKEKSEMDVWLRDWTNNSVIASSDTNLTYEREKIHFEQNFPDFFDNWKMEVSFADAPTVAASNASLFKNLVVLGAAMLLLLGALVFMFISAQKERALAERQAGFLANVTHELKTPLAVIQAAGENLSDGRVKDQDRLENYGSHIFNEAVRLRKMIEKLLDVAKADASETLIEPKPVYLDELVQTFLDDHKKYIKNKGFTVQTSISEDLPMVMIDTNSFDTILSNLVDNAIKYSKDGRYIGIILERDQKNVVLKVEDHGVGIPKKDISNIFEKFYRMEDTLTAQTKGHGLGLSIVKNLVELNGGTITVESESGEGSTFIVSFPIMVETPQKSRKDETSREEISTESVTQET